MAIRYEVIEGIGPVRLQKRRGSSSVRIHIHGSEVRVTLPHWLAYAQAIAFAKTRADWINKHRGEVTIISHGSYAGKQYQILFEPTNNTVIRSRITDHSIIIKIPQGLQPESAAAQQKLHKVVEKALKKESQTLIAPRLQDLALEHGFNFNSISFKKLKTRWGSCDHQDNIVINIFLLQMPWQLIDYVLIHELAHTRHRNHSTSFWEEVAAVLPDFKQRRKALKQHQPHLIIN